MDGTDENPTSEETPATTELVPSEPDGEINEPSESEGAVTEPEHPGVRKIQRLRMVWVVYGGLLRVVPGLFDPRTSPEKQRVAPEMLEHIENGLIEQNVMYTVVWAGLVIGLVVDLILIGDTGVRIPWPLHPNNKDSMGLLAPGQMWTLLVV